MAHLHSYGPTGPLGFPLSEKQARNLDTLLKALPKSKEFEYRKTIFLKAPTELNPGERSDVSWISTETPDRYDHGCRNRWPNSGTELDVELRFSRLRT